MEIIKKIKKLEGETFSKKAYDFLKKRIINNELKPGEPVDELEISNRLGISRTPVREALKQLEKEHLIIIYPRRGAFITSISLEKIQEIYQIRKIIEGQIAYEVVSSISKLKLSQIEKKLLLIKNKLDKGETNFIEHAVTAGRQLHNLILITYGNKTLMQIMNGLSDDIDRGCNFANRREHNIYKFLEHHLEIISKLKEGNAKEVKRLLDKHIEEAKASVL